ncbi:MAG: glucuronosyltransferase [Phycisphaeraceae bacterium]|nr:hypothetical protein [Phycisphaerales bacterium]MCB9860997.1 glucuronosyltransferase [Phycisphaeraceae bacterium]
MIFVTVGAQMPFDRMTRAVDAWAHNRSRDDVFAQIGTTEFTPSHMQWSHLLSPEEFRTKVEQCSVLVAHAGMGSILTALQVGKPILVMPRRGDLNETRNDHQVATAKRFRELGRIEVAETPEELAEALDNLGSLSATDRIQPFASDQLIQTVRAFINTGHL